MGKISAISKLYRTRSRRPAPAGVSALFWRGNRCLVFLSLMMGLSVDLFAQENAAAPGRLFDGREKILIVNGYSTSRLWPRFLQEKLDRFFGGRVLEVRSAVKSGTPMSEWVDLKRGRPLNPWIGKMRPLLRGSDGRPRIVLAQQTLQGVFGSRTVGIRGARDIERIRKGADAFGVFAEHCLKEGAEAVFLATHIFKASMEPTTGNERLALAELMRRKPPNVFAGPDVWEPTSKLYPEIYARDRLHPNGAGAELMAQKWFEALLHHDGREVPVWSKAARDSEVISDMQTRSPQPGGEFSKPRRDRQPSQRVLRRYDKDRDGRLNADERALFEKARASRRQTNQR